MDWDTAKEEEEVEGLDLDTFDFGSVLDGTATMHEFEIPIQPGLDNMMSTSDHIAQLQHQQLQQQQQQRNLQSQMAFIEDALATHPFFATSQQQLHNPYQHQPQFKLPPITSPAPTPSALSGSGSMHFPLPEIQISEFPSQRPSVGSASQSPYFGSFSSSPTGSSPTSFFATTLSGSGELPTVVQRSSPTSSGYTSPLSLSGQMHAFSVSVSSGTLGASSGTAGSGSGPVAVPPPSSSSASNNKRKKPLKKKQASLPNILPAPTAPSTSGGGPLSLSTSPTSSSSLPQIMSTASIHLSPITSLPSSPNAQPYSPPGHSPPTSPRSSPPVPLAAGAAWAADIKPSVTLPGLGQGPKIIKVLYDEVIFSAAKTPTKVTLMCTPTGLRPLSVECLINRSNLPQPVVVQPTQISIHDDSNDQRLAPTCTIIECHFPFPTVMKTCVGGVKVANVQFRLFHAPPAPSAPVLLDAFYKDGEMRHLPMVAYPHTKAKIQCWAIIIWYADKGPEYEQLTWAALAKRFAYFYTRQLNEPMHPQSLRFLGEKLGVPNAGKESSKDEIVTFETYMQTRVGHWLYNAVQAIKSYHDLWRNYSLRMFLTHKDAVILLKQMGAKPGDFLFRIPSQLAEEDTKAFKTRSPSSTLVFTYVQKVGDELKFAKVDVNDKVREDPKFVHQKKSRRKGLIIIIIIAIVIFMATHPMQELVNVLCLNEKGEMILRHKMDCAFNEKQKRKEHVVKSTVKSSGDDGDEYETY